MAAGLHADSNKLLMGLSGFGTHRVPNLRVRRMTWGEENGLSDFASGEGCKDASKREDCKKGEGDLHAF